LIIPPFEPRLDFPSRLDYRAHLETYDATADGYALSAIGPPRRGVRGLCYGFKSCCAAASVWAADPARSLVPWLALTGNGQGRDSEKANVMSRQANSLRGYPSGSLD
jgi:hypothetical protein